MRNSFKKGISKWFLLFLFGLMSVGMQAQYNEDEAINNWIKAALEQDTDSHLTSNDNGGFTGNNWGETGWNENNNISSSSGNYGSSSGSTASQIGSVFNANGTFASAYSSSTAALIAGPYFEGVNANGVVRTYMGNDVFITNERGDLSGTTNMNNLSLVGIYNYTLPSGEQLTIADDISTATELSGVSVLITVGAVSTPTSIPIVTPKPPCDKLAKANISDLVYNTENGVQTKGSLPSNVTIVPLASLPPGIVLTNSDTGFNSAVYRVDHGGGTIEYVYATAGTDDLHDVLVDGLQAFSSASAQYRISVDNARFLADWASNNGYFLSFTGHSLGGGLANVNALATGLSASIYNPAGLSQGTIDDDYYDINMDNTSNVTAYVVRGEPIDLMNNSLGTPVRADVVNYLGSPVDAAILYGVSNNLLVGYDLHKMSTVISYINCKD